MEIKTSTYNSLEKAYVLLDASSPYELASKFIKEDQKLLKTSAWDYANEKLVLNKVKELVERAINEEIAVGDKEVLDELKTILWFWYHHATGYAIWGHKDRARAYEFSQKALAYQTDDNPNQITQLLFLLVRDKETEAIAWLKAIVNEPDKSVAQGIVEEYRAGNFFNSRH